MRLRIPEVNRALEAGHIIVTPNRLLADCVSNQFTASQIHAGKQSWPRPVVASLYAWLASLWQTARYQAKRLPNLLSPAQERSLWQQLFEQYHPELFNSDAAAAMATGAGRTLAEWHIALEASEWDDYKDAAYFHSLKGLFARTCEERGCIARADLWRYASSLLQTYSGPPILFVGFEVISPALRDVLALLGGQGTIAASDQISSTPVPQNVLAIPCDSVASEFELAARRARFLFEAHPHQSVGVLVANLREHRAAIARAFESVFYPSRSAIGASRADALEAFHLASGEPSTNHPLISAALLMLEAAEGSLLAQDASALIRSPFLLGAGAERNRRALSDAYLRRRRDLVVTLPQLISATATCPLLQSVWKALDQVSTRKPDRASFSNWSEWISDLVSACGWPGEAKLTAQETATLDIWSDSLNQLASLTYISGPVPFTKTMAELRRLLRLSEAVGYGDGYSPVHVLDADASVDLEFDSVIVVGLSEGEWPQAEKSEPFIPLRLRRLAGVPGSSAGSIKSLRERRLRKMLTAAPEVNVTFTNALTPLAKRFVEITTLKLPVWNLELPIQSFGILTLERLEDEAAPALDTRQKIRGGVGIIKAQSQCPFQAFARYRLLADSLEEPSFGIDERDRGGNLHKALEHAWRTIKSSDVLRNMTPGELQGVISESVAASVGDEHGEAFHDLICEAERERLQSVLFEWLQYEKGRKIPFTVEFLEEARQIELSGLPLTVRVDRIDRLPDAKMLLLDYKSGNPSVKSLCGDRPREPQLMVYAAAVGEEVEGVYLAQVKARDVKVHGFAARDHFPETRRNRDAPMWAQERIRSQATLTKIAAEFTSGHAAVEPSFADACGFCPCKLICRVAEAKGDGTENADE